MRLASLINKAQRFTTVGVVLLLCLLTSLGTPCGLALPSAFAADTKETTDPQALRAYIETLRAKMRSNWHLLGIDHKKPLVLKFTLNAEGYPVRVSVEQEGDTNEQVLSALKTLLLSAPFGPLPEGVPSKRLTVLFHFDPEE